MGVSQQFINLLNLSRERLLSIAAELDIEIEGDARKWDIIHKLSIVPAADLAPLAGDWIYAGRTSITYARVGNGDPLAEEDVVSVLTSMCDGVNPFQESVRPEALDSRPKLIDAASVDGKIFLSFGAKKPVAQVLADFEEQTIHGDEYFTVAIRLDSSVVEIRSNQDRVRSVNATWLAEFASQIAELQEPAGGDDE